MIALIIPEGILNVGVFLSTVHYGATACTVMTIDFSTKSLEPLGAVSLKSKLTEFPAFTSGSATTYVELLGIVFHVAPVVVENSCVYWSLATVLARSQLIPPIALLERIFIFSWKLLMFSATCVSPPTVELDEFKSTKP